MPPIEGDEFVLLNHMLDDILTNYQEHGINRYTPLEQARLVHQNPHLRGSSTDDLVSLIAIMAVRLFESTPDAPSDP